VPWWWLLAGALALVVGLLVWQPWGGAANVAAPTDPPTPSPTEPVIEPSLLPPLPSFGPSPSLSSTSNVEPGATPPGQDTVFDAASSQALFVTADQIGGAVPSAVGPIVPSTQTPPGWGLPANGLIVPMTCQVASTVVAQPPTAYAVRDWTGGTAFTFRQEVTLLASPVETQRAFATLVGTVDACATYTVVDPTGGTGGHWVTQPAIEGVGLYPSIVQQVTVQGQTTTTNGYRGHLLVGNAIVTWTASTTGNVSTLGGPDGLSAIVQARALAAVQASR
jgi:hypothetical protein